MPSWLSALLAPLPEEEFLSRYWQKEHLFCRGAAERFSGLLSWTALNRILAHHWRETYRFRLAHQGRDLDPACYVDRSGTTPRVRAKDVTDRLRRGATLSFAAIDELHEPLTRLAESCESFFRGDTKINVYAAWRALHGLDLHRDDQEIFVLQLDGRKRWLMYGFSVDGVDRGQLESGSVPPSGAGLDQILHPGDLLYVPKGCYHLAVPMNEPALHLTVSIRNPRGMDSSNVKPRPSFNLPWSATPEGLPPGRDFLVRLKTPSYPVAGTASSGGAVELQCGSRRCRFPRGMLVIIEQLNDSAPLPVGRLIDGAAGQLDEGMVRLLLAMLVNEDLIAITV